MTDYSDREYNRFNNDGPPKLADNIQRMRARIVFEEKTRERLERERRR